MRLLKTFALWFLIAFPFSPSLDMLAMKGSDCFGDNVSGTPIGCLGLGAVLAPIAAFSDIRIPGDRSTIADVLPKLLLTSALAAAFMTALRAFWHARHAPDASI